MTKMQRVVLAIVVTAIAFALAVTRRADLDEVFARANGKSAGGAVAGAIAPDARAAY